LSAPATQTDVVIDGIKQMITSGRLRAGSRLPPEKDLAVELGVSRGPLREGIRALAMLGVLEARQGDGTYVTSLEPGRLLSPLGLLADLHSDADAAHLLAVRRAIEAETVSIAAERMTPDEFAEAEKILSGVDVILQDDPDMDLEAHIEADARFHRLIAGASGNPAFSAMVDSLLGSTFRARIWRSITQRDTVRSAHTEHRAILRALRDRDAARARELMIEHISRVEDFAATLFDETGLRDLPGSPVPAPDARADLGAFDLTGRTAVVTGASRGIGFAMAVALARAGADIIGVSSTLETAGSQVADAVASHGRRFDAHRVDLADRAQVLELGARLADLAPDIFVGNAGVIERTPAIDHPLDAWDRVLETDLSNQFVLAQLLARPMIARGRGRILFTASVLSFQGGVNVPSYAAAKSGLAGLTRALANEWTSLGVTVNAIAPGYFATTNTEALRADPDRSTAILDRIPAGRWGASDDIGGATVFLASSAADYVSGVVLPVDGGWLGR
jgi:2-deoxy-D-gluconate 3-dehydrogenase